MFKVKCFRVSGFMLLNIISLFKNSLIFLLVEYFKCKNNPYDEIKKYPWFFFSKKYI